jgi:uncharacterized protein (TIGR02001 family)
MKNVKRLIVGTALVTGSLLAAPAMAEVSGNLSVASQYIFRGVSFGDPQVSGGVDWSDKGLYAGTWISSAAGEQEVDFYGGWANDFLDVGYIYYYFPDQASAAGTEDAAEVYAGIASGPFSAKVWYAPAGFTNAADDEYVYVEGNLDLGLTEKASLGLHVGVTENTGKAYDNDPETTFVDYAITVSFGDLFIMASAIDYDKGIQTENDPTFTVGYSWSFDDIL